MAIIHPYSALYGIFVPNSTYLPFAAVANASSTFPYATAPNSYAGPFNSQQPNVNTYCLDACNVDFQNT
jgi:hypothetical protein